MTDQACFSSQALTVLAAVALVVQGAIVGLFWVGIRALQAHITDAREVRDQALAVNEEAIRTSRTSVGMASEVIRPRRRS